ncbi:hypothetical protein E0K89_005260 [Aquicoccus sp. SCR17]|nr:hypothetical protein [Carideicomes alvinocaridis]
MFLSEEIFLKAAENGLDFQLIGSRGRVNCEIPASSFKKVLEQVDMLEAGEEALQEGLK